MARMPRLHVEGGIYHVILRGNNQQEIFFHPNDRLRLYQLIEEGTRKYQYRVHAFCLMSNHVHMAIQVGTTPLSKVVQNFAFRYARWINHVQRRTGHLFQGRYRAPLVDTDHYLLQLVRYIHMNPVRANLVEKLSAYPWSSHHVYLGRQTLPWLCTDLVLGMLGRGLDKARRQYNAFMSAGSGEDHRHDFYAGERDPRIIGDESFADDLLQRTERPVQRVPGLDQIISYACAQHGIPRDELFLRGRNRKRSATHALISWLNAKCGSEPVTKVAAAINRDASAVSRNSSELEALFQGGGPRARELGRHLRNIKRK